MKKYRGDSGKQDESRLILIFKSLWNSVLMNVLRFRIEPCWKFLGLHRNFRHSESLESKLSISIDRL